MSNAVRDYIDRLSTLNSGTQPTKIVARLLVPWNAGFAFSHQYVETMVSQSRVPIARAGHPIEIEQGLLWLDEQKDSRNIDDDTALGVDLTAMLALATGRRIDFAKEIAVSFGTPDAYPLEVARVDSELLGPVEDNVGPRFGRIWTAISKTSKKEADALCGALRTRNTACCIMESDHASAYALLITALETLSQRFGRVTYSWEGWDEHNKWDDFITTLHLSKEDTQRLREQILKDRFIRIGQTFVEYIVSNLAPSFWEERYHYCVPMLEAIPITNVSPPQVTVTRSPDHWDDAGPLKEYIHQEEAILRKRLKKSYGLRSKVVHENIPLSLIGMIPGHRELSVNTPGSADTPLKFMGLRRILDHILWREIDGAASL